MQRYARQILLGPVGGLGQEALLAAPVRVQGLPTTAAYLAAGGTPVDTDDTAGFFASSPVALFNPDAVPHSAPKGLIARLTVPRQARDERGGDPCLDFEEFPFAVAVGADGVVFRASGCAACFALTVEGIEPGEPSVAVQALAALAWQRMVLKLADPLGALRLHGEPLSIRRCDVHR